MPRPPINNPNALCECYKRYYRAQSGGLLPVFRGTRQVGGGFGGILSFIRRIAPFVMPVIGKAFSSFMSSSASGLREGKSVKDSVTGAIKPALTTGVNTAVEEFSSQKGRGRIKRRASNKRHTPARTKRVYKGRGHSRQPPSKKAKRSKDTVTNLITNF